ncbi:hypothetical protein DQK91_01055 [Oceanidesulfovibrio marinus]|uniref:SPOR domain-containing protein n=2 Tax=Oceanidesulfovibrio marinus TaxID=370038 RepID=A0A6P1ZPR5_9BACT|nr:hypothetical protein DQK91_01055 [Oceanidesulfovibrio marinus]
MIINGREPMNTQTRTLPPALPGMLFLAILVAAFSLFATPCKATAQQTAQDDTPLLDWSTGTVPLTPEGAPAATARRFAVQVALVRDAGTARDMAADLASRGHDPYILTKADDSGALWHAVRLGVYDSLVEALRAARNFYKQESVAPVVTELGSLYGLSLQDARFFVQVGAFESRGNAVRYAQKLIADGRDAGVVRLDHDGGEDWNVVHIGVFKTFDAAAEAADSFKSKNGGDCFVVVISDKLLEKRTVPVPGPEPAQTNATTGKNATDEKNATAPGKAESHSNATAPANATSSDNAARIAPASSDNAARTTPSGSANATPKPDVARIPAASGVEKAVTTGKATAPGNATAEAAGPPRIHQ